MRNSILVIMSVDIGLPTMVISAPAGMTIPDADQLAARVVGQAKVGGDYDQVDVESALEKAGFTVHGFGVLDERL